MVVSIKTLTPLCILRSMTYYYRVNHNGSIIYFGNHIKHGSPFKVKAKDLMLILKNTETIIIR